MRNAKFIEGLKEKRQELIRQLAALDQTINTFSELDEPLEATPVIESPKEKNGSRLVLYSPKKDPKNVVFDFIKEGNRFVPIRAVALYLQDYYSRSKEKHYRKNTLDEYIEWARSLNRSLNRSKRTARFTEGTNYTFSFWGLPEWLDKDGQIKEGHDFESKWLATGALTGNLSQEGKKPHSDDFMDGDVKFTVE